MGQPMNLNRIKPVLTIILKVLLLVAAGTILMVWLTDTPPGLLGKADALGYAVCHRIPAHSYFLGDRQLPLCARCTGMHLGAMLGLVYQFVKGKQGGMPSKKISIVLIIFFLAFAFDGVNSYLNLPREFSGASQAGWLRQISEFLHFYTPQNWLRLATGTGLGLGIAAVLYPVFNQTMWVDWDAKPALSSWKQLGVLFGFAALIDLTVISRIPILVYPLAIMSAFNILVILGMIYAIVWVMITRRENRYTSPKELWIPLLVGFTVALLQIGLMDYARYLLTGTWSGFFS
jgi:uncharacterized membrane protein